MKEEKEKQHGEKRPNLKEEKKKKVKDEEERYNKENMVKDRGRSHKIK